MAYAKMKGGIPNYIIVVMLEKIEDHQMNEMQTLKAYLRTNSYIDASKGGDLATVVKKIKSAMPKVLSKEQGTPNFQTPFFPIYCQTNNLKHSLLWKCLDTMLRIPK